MAMTGSDDPNQSLPRATAGPVCIPTRTLG
jgi:hypothetical protein